ncbi:DUF397 domain-containing protein [Kitasatospora sp. NPDC008115]|uniref:DUF397 domain-containing protein n=1 Tax=Kitasatospora sp. NPDC008115 TaxID=3364022 RepID=UPI0036E82B4D
MKQLNWQKSTYSGENMDCVEIASDGDLVHIRESDDPTAVIAIMKAQLAACLQATKAGRFDHHTR